MKGHGTPGDLFFYALLLPILALFVAGVVVGSGFLLWTHGQYAAAVVPLMIAPGTAGGVVLLLSFWWYD